MFLDSRKPNILVIGDLMLDYSTTGKIEKLANEAPIPVFLKKDETVHLGGCGNVVENLHSLGCEKLFLIGQCGSDGNAKILQNMLDHKNIYYKLWNILPTTISKHRFFCNNKLVFRYDEEIVLKLSPIAEVNIVSFVRRILEAEHIDCIYFSDYNKGFLTKDVCQGILALANERGIFTCVDPKNDYTKYKGCTLIKPNRNEMEKMFDIKYSGLNMENILKEIKEKVGCKHVVITLGDAGITHYSEEDGYLHWKPESKEIIDVTGAGDIVGSVLSYYLPKSNEKHSIIKLASYLATLSVSHLGTYVIQQSDILEALKHFRKNKFILRNDVKQLRGKKIFTNGCFDLVHEGHLGLFDYCKSLCNEEDSVIVGLNSDESIRRLKGETRPVRNLSQRIAMLNAIQNIDWIVVFDEDTPLELLKTIEPDILVKGGDYSLERIVGKEYCKHVQIYPYKEHISTTKIVETIKHCKQS